VSALVRNGFSLAEVGAMTVEQVELYMQAIAKANQTEEPKAEAPTFDKDGWM
jgi:predicted regulator of amino acid metabolism with ACT domain